MGITSVMMDWLIRLRDRGVFADRTEILEFGPQDLRMPAAYLEASVAFLCGDPERARAVVQPLTDTAGKLKAGAQIDMWRALGATHYSSVDSLDGTATYNADLNLPLQNINRQFPLTFNGGTFEHVFDIAQCFKTIHNITADDGIMMHVLPSMGGVNHGFWNIHPTVIYDVADANGYEIVDVQYLDGFRARNARHDTQLAQAGRFDFEKELPIQDHQLRTRQFNVAKETSVLYANNVIANQRPGLDWDYDICLVAMRKVPNAAGAPFRNPTQRFYR